MPINLLRSLTAIVNQIPDLKTVTYQPRSFGDKFGTAVNWDARRGPMSRQDVNGMDRNFATWYLYALDGQTVLPTRLGKVTDGSDVWHLLDVVRDYGDLHFICSAILEVS